MMPMADQELIALRLRCTQLALEHVNGTAEEGFALAKRIEEHVLRAPDAKAEEAPITAAKVTCSVTAQMVLQELKSLLTGRRHLHPSPGYWVSAEALDALVARWERPRA